MSKIRKKVWIYLLAMTLFSGYLFFSNTFAVALNKDFSKTKQIKSISTHQGNPVIFSKYGCTLNDDKYDSVTIQGFAACETLEHNKDKRIEIILTGEKNTYSVSALLEFSDPVTVKEKYKSDNILGATNNFTVKFPTIHLKNDIYRLGVYVWENEENSGFLDLRAKYIKTYDGFHEYAAPEVNQVAANDEAEVAAIYYSGADSLKDGYYRISGLAAKKDVDSAQSDIYINLIFDDGTVKSFATNIFAHSWFNTYFESNLYMYSEFAAFVPSGLVQGKTAQIAILVDNGGISSNENIGEYNVCKFDESGYERSYAEPELGFNTTAKDKHVADLVSYNGLNAPRSSYYFFNGAAAVDAQPTKDMQLYIQFRYKDGTNQAFPALMFPHPYEDSLEKSSTVVEYQISVALDDIRKEDVDMYMIIKIGEQVYSSETPVHYIWTGNQFLKEQ